MLNSYAYKTPPEIKDYSIDWSAVLSSETIVSSTWDAGGLDLMVNNPIPTIANNLTTVWLSAGTCGNSYLVTNTITTTGGREFQESFICYVQDVNEL